MDKYAAFVDKFLRENEKELHAYMGLASEAGEVLDLYKKDRIYKMDISKEQYIDELGDVLFYLQGICNYLDIDLDVLKENNIVKLLDRYGAQPNFED